MLHEIIWFRDASDMSVPAMYTRRPTFFGVPWNSIRRDISLTLLVSKVTTQ